MGKKGTPKTAPVPSTDYARKLALIYRRCLQIHRAAEKAAKK